MNFDIFIIIVTLLYLSQVLLFLFGVLHTRDSTSNPLKQTVSVIIAARNEEKTLTGCLEALAVQTYPRTRYEVIIVNDASTDRTQEICDRFTEKYPFFRSLKACDIPSHPGKTGALIQGIEASTGEIVLITDADCRVPECWIESTMRRYDDSVGIVGGMTVQAATNGFEGMQSLDWTYLLGIASASVALGNPLSTIGNNLSFRRAAYEDVGGYRALPFSITEDYALFQAIVKTRKWKYYYPIDPNLLVVSKPCGRMVDVLRQKHRWAKGGLDMRVSGFLIMAIGFLLHTAIVASFFMGSIFAGCVALLCKTVGDYFFLFNVLKSLKRTEDLRFFFWFEVYFSLYVVILPFLVFFGGKVIWKERAY